MNKGPNPSREAVEAGAATQFSLKKEFPVKKAALRLEFKFLAASVKALRVASKTVVSPPASAFGDTSSIPLEATVHRIEQSANHSISDASRWLGRREEIEMKCEAIILN